MATQGKRKGLSVTASITDDLVSTFRVMATKSSGVRRESTFASMVLNFVAECAEALGTDWEGLKPQMPGYAEVIALRRKRASVEQMHYGDELAETQDILTHLNSESLERVRDLAEREMGLKPPLAPKRRAK